MSTLAWELAGDIAPAEQIEAKAGFWSRLIEARQARANRHVYAYLATMGDERLTDLGFSKDDICALHAGVISLPNTQEG